MKRMGKSILALIIGCSAPLLVWVAAGSALYSKRTRPGLPEKALSNLTCSVDADCPPGFVCEIGRCVPVK